MNTTTFTNHIHTKHVLVSDGATGSNLQARGLDKGKAAEVWVLENPQAIRQLHTDFLVRIFC